RSRIIVRRWVMITITSVIRATVRSRVGVVVTPATVWRPPIAASIGKDRACSRTQYERAQISCCIVGCNGAVRIGCLRDVGYVINRRTRRNRVDLLWNRHARCPLTSWSRSHEPHALETKVIRALELDHLVLGIRGVFHGCALDWLELRFAGVINFDFGLCLVGLD